jgi:hypothetical protein
MNKALRPVREDGAQMIMLDLAFDQSVLMMGVAPTVVVSA